MSTKPPEQDPPLLEPGDFYLNEQGLMVFTQKYHLRRGFCCKSGCLHCPWGYRNKQRRQELPPGFEVVVRDTGGE